MERQRSTAGSRPLPAFLHPHLGQDLRCMGLLKLAQLLNVVHQVAPSDILHHKIQTILGGSGRGLEARARPSGVIVSLCVQHSSNGQFLLVGDKCERLGSTQSKAQSNWPRPLGGPRRYKKAISESPSAPSLVTPNDSCSGPSSQN